MNWQVFGTTLLVMLIGYIIGSISSSIIISKIIHKKDIRTIGSGNAGSTNIARNFGNKMGLLVLMLDFSKPVIAILIAYTMRHNLSAPWSKTMIQAAGLGTIIGHIWPIFFKFKGGKGAACIAGFISSINWLLFFIGLISMIIIVKKTKKVSLASIFCPIITIIFQVIFHFIPYLDGNWFNPMMTFYPWWVNTLFLIFVCILVIVKHIPNIKRLIMNKENTINSFKK